MQVIVAITMAFSIALSLCLITYKFMLPNRVVQFGCFFGIFMAEFLFMLFVPETPGVTEIAFLICIVVIAFSIYPNLKSHLKSFEIAFSILLLFTIFSYIMGIPIVIILTNLFEFEKHVGSFIMEICYIVIGILMRKYKDKLFKPSDNVKILKFYLALKILFFTIINFVISLSIEDFSILYYVAVGLFTAVTVIGFFLIKYNSKLIMELENENRRNAVRQIESENINKKYDEIIKLRHYYTSLFRSSVEYIEANNMPGLKKYYGECIAPINDQLMKEIEAYDQIKYIHVAVIKSRIIELINTVSHMPNVKFTLDMNKEIHHVNMLDSDLFTVINIIIDNAVEEVMTQEEGIIKITMGQIRSVFLFQIKNSLNDLVSTPKPNNTGKGLEIAEEIVGEYPNVRFGYEIEHGFYTSVLEVRYV